jgi:hypothetical protein
MAVTPKVLLKRSSVIGKVPVAGDLQYGELAINFADGRIYYKDANDNIKNFVDSAIIQSIVSEMSTDSAEVINLIQTYSLDSSEIIALIDSGYVQARQDFSYASLTGVPDIAAIAKANSTDSAEVSAIITSDVDKSFVDALNVDADTLDGNDGSYYLDWTNVTNKPDLTDSVYAQGMIDSNFQNLSQSIIPISNGVVDLGSLSNRFGSIYLSGSTIYLGSLALSDSNGSLLVTDTSTGEKASVDIDSQIAALITSAYIQARQSYDYNQLINVPTLQDSSQVSSIITNQVNKSFVDALNVDADTLDGQNASWYRDWTNTTNKPAILDNVDVDLQIDDRVDKAYVDALNVDADTLDNLNSTQFLRSDQSDSMQGSLTIDNNLTVGGYVAGPATFYIDPAGVGDNTGKVVIRGDLQVDGVQTIVNSTTVSINDKNIVLADSAADSAEADGAGITVNGANANITYTASTDTWNFNKKVSAPNIDVSGAFVSDTLVGKYLGFDSDFAQKSTDNLSEGVNQYYTTVRHNADTLLQVDSAYVQARQITYDFLDSAEAINLIDSSYVQARQDYAYASLTGAPNIDALTVDSAEVIALVDSAYVQARQITYDFLDSAEAINLIDSSYVQARQITYDFLDSAEAINLIDSSYVQLRQDYAYASLTGAPTNVSAFTNDANYLDSNTSQAVINTNFAAKTTDDLTEGSTNQYYLKARVDSDIAASLNDSGNTVTVTINNTIEDKVDSAYVLDRVAEAPFLDSADAINLIDSAYVQLRQDYAYSSLTGKPNQGLNTTDSVTFSGLTISGNLTVSGTQSVINTEVFKVIDPLIHLGDSNINSDIVDIGFIGKYYADGQERHTGLVRDANDGEYYLYTNSIDSASDSVNQINLSAPGFTLATLNAGNITGQYQGFDSDFGTKTTSNLTEGSNLYYTDGRVTAHVDSAYVQALQTPQDFAFSSLTGTPTTVSTFTNDANYLDSNTVTGVIDAAYVQSNQTAQDFSYASLTGKPNILDSANISSIIIADVDQAFVNGLNIDADNLDGQSGSYYLNYTNLTNTPNVLDSADVTAIHNALGGVDSAAITNLIDSAYVAARTSAGTDSATVVTIINDTVDSAYISALGFGTGGGTVDSADIIAIVDSAYVQARQLNQVAVPLTQVSYEFTATSGQSSFTGLDIDSGKFQTYLNGSLLAASDYTFNSTKVDLVVAADSGDILNVIKFSGNDTGATAIQQRHYIYTATSGQTIFTGSDDNSATLSYTQGRINVYLNGLLLIDSADYTENAAGDTVTFTSGVTAGHIVNIQTLTGNTGSFAPLSQTLYEYTADSGQTVFTGVDDNAATLDFSNDKVVVYLNGILLTSTDYTLSGGNTVTLDTAADSGNHLTVAKLSGNNIGLDSAQVNGLIAASPSGTDSASVLSLVNGYIVQSDSDFTTTTADQVVDTFAAATYRTAKYIVQFSHPSDSKYHSTEVLLMHDGTTVYMTEYAEVKTDSSLGSIDADISGGNVRLLVTPSYTNTGVNVTRTNVTV